MLEGILIWKKTFIYPRQCLCTSASDASGTEQTTETDKGIFWISNGLLRYCMTHIIEILQKKLTLNITIVNLRS